MPGSVIIYCSGLGGNKQEVISSNHCKARGVIDLHIPVMHKKRLEVSETNMPMRVIGSTISRLVILLSER